MVLQRRRARRLAYWNGAVWAIGNGLTSTMLVVYLAMEFDVRGIGLGISLILAAPRLAGLLRLVTPALIGRLADRKRFCLGAFLLSGLTLWCLPWVVAPGCLPSGAASVAALVVLWCVYHLLQYLATVALWSWLADLVPLRIRGRFLGRRERWMVAGQAVGMLAAGLFVWGCHATHPQVPRWQAYAVTAVVGACFMLAALVPLAAVPGAMHSRIVQRGASLASLLAPFGDRRFRRLLLFGCWLSFSNGVTQMTQSVYPGWELGMGLFVMLALKTGMRLGQWTMGPRLGAAADRVGNRPVMVLSLLLVAQGPLFYLLASPQRPWWIVGAWTMWIAWVGLNVCLPNLMLKLSPSESNTPYIATYFAVTGLCVALSTVIGGVLFDLCRHERVALPGGLVLDYYHYSFLLGWIMRSCGALVLLLVIEGPGHRADGR
jgi:MFS family permease